MIAMPAEVVIIVAIKLRKLYNHGSMEDPWDYYLSKHSIHTMFVFITLFYKYTKNI